MTPKNKIINFIVFLILAMVLTTSLFYLKIIAGFENTVLVGLGIIFATIKMGEKD